MSHPNKTEQKPKPDLAIERNFFLDISLPRNWPSMSMPATFTLVSEASNWGSPEKVTSEGSEELDGLDILGES